MPVNPGGGADRGVGVGLGITLALHVVITVAAFLVLAAVNEEMILVLLLALVAIGIFQLVYMVPVILIAFWTGHRSVGKGLIIGAAVTAGLNTACWGLIGAGNIFKF